MNWFSGSIPDAIAEAKNFNKVFLVYIEGNDELSNKMSATYNDPLISSKLNNSDCVALKLAADSVSHRQFCAIYPVLVIPSSYFIGKNGIPIEVLTGCVEVSVFSTKLDNIFQIHQKSISTNGQMQSPQEHVSSNEESVQIASNSSAAAACETSSQSSSCTSSATPVEAQSQSSSVKTNSPDESSVDKPSLEERVERAKSLLEVRRQNKAAEEQEGWVTSGKECISSPQKEESERKRRKLEEAEDAPKERADEQERRKLGKALQKAQQTRQENELKEWAQSRAKEKEEERQARERIRAQIAQDRAERAAKYQQVKAEEIASQKEKEMARMKEEQERAAREAAMRSTVARLQFRLPDGTSVTHQFPADSTLDEARKFVLEEIRPSFSNFTLCTTFPRKHFTEADYVETLRDLQLAPSAAVLVLPGQAVTRMNNEVGFFRNMFWLLLAPFISLWRTFSSLFRGSADNEPQESVPHSQASTSGTKPSTSQRGSNQRDGPMAEGQVTQRKNPKFYKKEGNIFRISNQQTDDDDNNTWNGNSTQQM